MREQIWATLCNTKFKGYCLSLLINKYQNYDRNTNIFLAIASSGSIAAWAIWDVYPMLWGFIIAVSQVLTVLKPHFPYFKYVKELNSKNFDIELLNIDIERLWYKFQSGRIAENDADEIYFDLKKQIANIFNFGDETIFQVDNKIEKEANEKMKVFLKNNYNISIQVIH